MTSPDLEIRCCRVHSNVTSLFRLLRQHNKTAKAVLHSIAKPLLPKIHLSQEIEEILSNLKYQALPIPSPVYAFCVYCMLVSLHHIFCAHYDKRGGGSCSSRVKTKNPKRTGCQDWNKCGSAQRREDEMSLTPTTKVLSEVQLGAGFTIKKNTVQKWKQEKRTGVLVFE
ncbi:hypothetical protein OUZ56_025347 [Daphnia magna]|uniref:Uncharacterized protein n=1 Tax=Daphnia magna TaxID=35525 RepID=A0ABQ9ZJL2_9CRUS|nr:hypothetical protein OUZ56_025347 [Daphnia magna]